MIRPSPGLSGSDLELAIHEIEAQGGTVFDHLGLKVGSLSESKEFYLKALAPLGAALVMEGPYGVGIGPNRKPSLWLSESKEKPTPVHIAFTAETRGDVDAFYRAAIAAGGKDNGPPGLRPHYHPDYYGAFVIGPDGHNIEAVCHKAEVGPRETF